MTIPTEKCYYCSHSGTGWRRSFQRMKNSVSWSCWMKILTEIHYYWRTENWRNSGSGCCYYLIPILPRS